jgi:hypothetical protein
MLGFAPRYERPQPDQIRGDLTKALQRNESAGERARDAIEEVFRRNDSLGNRVP